MNMDQPADANAYVYILRCADGTLYTGWTNNLDRRLSAHNAGRAAKYTRSRRPVTLAYFEMLPGPSPARRREAQIKQLSRAQKFMLIKQQGDKTMGHVPAMEEAFDILKQYNKAEFHLKHARIVSGVLRWFARQHDPKNADFWAIAGLLHDLDFELYPDQHCIKTEELLGALDIEPALIRAACSHGWGATSTPYQPECFMEKMLFAVDELTGLIGAVALMRPSRSVSDLEVKSVMKKYKTPSFAAGCSREVIAQGAGMLNLPLEDLIARTIEAMRSLIPELEI